MDEIKFWKTVAEMKWPDIDIDDAKYWFMKNHTTIEAESFRNFYLKKRNELIRASGSEACCDSWDDTLAHIIGLGEEVYKRCIDNPNKIIQRYRDGDYEESFAYCIPYPSDYEKLSDSGYSNYLRSTAELLDELENTDQDDVPPRIFRQYPKIIEVCKTLLDKNWRRAVEKYHEHFGPGYADEWPLQGRYGIPNFILDLERYRLRS